MIKWSYMIIWQVRVLSKQAKVDDISQVCNRHALEFRTFKKIVIRRCRKVYKSEKCFPVMIKSIEFNETFKVYSRQEDFVKLWDID